jgi:hypothetical protein
MKLASLYAIPASGTRIRIQRNLKISAGNSAHDTVLCYPSHDSTTARTTITDVIDAVPIVA